MKRMERSTTPSPLLLASNRKSKIKNPILPNPPEPNRTSQKNIFSVRVGQIGNQRKNSSSPQPMVSLPTRSSALDNQNTLTKSPADGKFRLVDLPIYIDMLKDHVLRVELRRCFPGEAVRE